MDLPFINISALVAIALLKMPDGEDRTILAAISCRLAARDCYFPHSSAVIPNLDDLCTDSTFAGLIGQDQ